MMKLVYEYTQIPTHFLGKKGNLCQIINLIIALKHNMIVIVHSHYVLCKCSKLYIVIC